MSLLAPLNRALALRLEAVPAPLLRPLAGRRRVNDRGDTHDLVVQAALRAVRLQGLHFDVADVARGRAGIRRSARMGCRFPSPSPRIDDLTLPCGLAARRYRPAAGDARGLIVWLHGGGWVVGDLDTADSACQWLAHRGRFAVVSVDYRLAPEHPWPAAPDDAEAAWRDVRVLRAEWGLAAVPMGAGGDSAGGNLSAVLSHRTRGGADAPAFQLLVYPGLDLRRETESVQLFADDLALSHRTIGACLDHYRADPLHPDASPLLAEAHEGLPPSVVAICGFDPLRDEAEQYVQVLEQARVPVRVVTAPTLPHGFLHFDGLSRPAADAWDATVDALVGVVDGLRAPA